jgi:hypothetical protein
MTQGKKQPPIQIPAGIYIINMPEAHLDAGDQHGMYIEQTSIASTMPEIDREQLLNEDEKAMWGLAYTIWVQGGCNWESGRMHQALGCMQGMAPNTFRSLVVTDTTVRRQVEAMHRRLGQRE